MARQTRIEINKALEIDKQKSLELFNKGFKVKEISKKLSRDRHAVGRWLRDLGCEYSTCNKTPVNSESFFSITTEEQAYWLGFLTADGYVSDDNYLELSLQLRDSGHLEKFKKFLQYEGAVRKDHFRCRLVFKDQKLIPDLVKLGVIQRKSLILKFPTEEQVPKKLIRHFIRGYFDGDGCIVYHKGVYKTPKCFLSASLLGTKEFLEQLMITLEVNRNLHKRKEAINTYTLLFSCTNAQEFLEYIYKNSDIYLDRKFKKWEDSY